MVSSLLLNSALLLVFCTICFCLDVLLYVFSCSQSLTQSKLIRAVSDSTPLVCWRACPGILLLVICIWQLVNDDVYSLVTLFSLFRKPLLLLHDWALFWTLSKLGILCAPLALCAYSPSVNFCNFLRARTFYLASAVFVVLYFVSYSKNVVGWSSKYFLNLFKCLKQLIIFKRHTLYFLPVLIQFYFCI